MTASATSTEAREGPVTSGYWSLTLGSIGVVFGDIGTSPLYAFREAVVDAAHGEPVSRVIVLGVAVCLIWYGYLNYLRGFGSFRLPSGTPIASLYAIIPLSGVLIALFTVEQLVNGLRNGFDHPEPPEDDGAIPLVEGSAQTGPRP